MTETLFKCEEVLKNPKRANSIKFLSFRAVWLGHAIEGSLVVAIGSEGLRAQLL